MTTTQTTKRALTRRQLEIARMFTVDAMTAEAIADKLNLSAKTVEAHKFNIYRKLKVRNVAELYRALVENLIPDSGR